MKIEFNWGFKDFENIETNVKAKQTVVNMIMNSNVVGDCEHIYDMGMQIISSKELELSRDEVSTIINIVENEEKVTTFYKAQVLKYLKNKLEEEKNELQRDSEDKCD